MTDDEKMEKICGDFIKNLMQINFANYWSYVHLAKRLWMILDWELRYQVKKDLEKSQMGQCKDEKPKDLYDEFCSIVKKEFPSYRIQPPVVDNDETTGKDCA